jgi:hypothetical protein
MGHNATTKPTNDAYRHGGAAGSGEDINQND